MVLTSTNPLHPVYELLAKGIYLYFSGDATTKFLVNNQLSSLGYSIDKIFDDSASSFQALGLISKDGSRPPVLVSQGTVDEKDAIDDANPNGVGFNEFSANKDAVKTWITGIISNKTKNPAGIKVDLTGQSLGGALAQWFTSEYPDLIREAVTFQSPGITKAASDTFISKGGKSSQITHYIVNGDLVSLGGEAFLPGTLRVGDYQTSAFDPEKFGDKHIAGILNANIPGVSTTVTNELTVTLGDLNKSTFTFTGQDWGDFIDKLNRTNPTLATAASNRSTVEAARIQSGSSAILVAQVTQAVLTPTPYTRNDFNGDGKTDILWRNNDGSIATWQMNSSTATPSSVGALAAGWTTAGTGDFNGDSKADILLKNTDGSVATWQMNGSVVTKASSIGTLNNGWSIAGTGDFNGDGTSDILLRNPNGSIATWQMNNQAVTQANIIGTAGADWTVAGTDDFNGDGKADILLQKTDGSVALWTIDAASVVNAKSVGTLSSGWSIASTGDLNGDGKADILLRNTNGSVADWLMNGSNIIATNSLGSAPTNWKITGTGDFNGDGKAELLWRNDNGGVATWQTDGTSILSAGATSIPTAATSWNIVTPIG